MCNLETGTLWELIIPSHLLVVLFAIFPTALSQVFEAELLNSEDYKNPSSFLWLQKACQCTSLKAYGMVFNLSTLSYFQP